MNRKPESEQEALPVEFRKKIAEEGAAQVRAWAEMDTWSIEEGLLLCCYALKTDQILEVLRAEN